MTARVRFRRRLFISYEDEDANDLAGRAVEIFESAGHYPWAWFRDARSGAYTFEEISENIENCDRMVYICTPASHASKGQRYERAQALEFNKKIDIIAFDREHVSGVIRHVVAKLTTPDRFDATCAEMAEEFARSPLLTKGAANEEYAVEQA